MKKKRLKNRVLATLLSLFLSVSALPLSVSAESVAKREKNVQSVGAGTDHTLSASNNYDISKELIMPGESFRIEPQYEVFHTVGYYGQDVTNPWLYNASLELGDVSIISKLVRNTADVSGLESITDTYNVIKMAYDRGDLSDALAQMPEDPELRAQLYEALQEALSGETTVTVGYINNTNTPIVLQQVRKTSSNREGVLYGGEYGETPIVEAGSTYKSDCTLKFFEPYYTISYDKLLDGEEEGLPECYYIQRDKQEIVLPNLVRPGCHFDKWDGGMYFADREKVGDTTVLSFDWDNNLANATYNFGDETLYPTFKYGYTVTFNPRGGTMDGKESAIYELDTESENFFDIGDYVPQREGYTFLGWCYKSSAYYDSLIEDTSNYGWMKNISGYDIQLYAKWAEESDEELERNGFRFYEDTGELKIISNKGMDGWQTLCTDTDNECKSKVKSISVGSGVERIDTNMFRDCVNLTSVALPDTMGSISDYAFTGCSSLKTITLPEHVYNVGYKAFYQCTNLEKVIFETTNSKQTFNVYSNTFEECSPNLVIYVNPFVLDTFKETYMPGYADIIESVEAETKVIELIKVDNATTDLKEGEKPVFTGTVPEGAPYVIDYESWFGADNEFISSSDYWNSAYIERGWCDGLISTFKADTEYSYGLYIKLTEDGYNAGYRFDKDVALSVNGKIIDLNPEYVTVSDDGGLATLGSVLTITPSEKPKVVIGDVDCDGEITITDSALIQKFCARLATPGDETVSQLADTNGDGKVTICDATLIQKYLCG
ncbi:MAG: leucine-rich repeat protein [Ruminococcus sp.]